jgi:hypothetical protein
MAAKYFSFIKSVRFQFRAVCNPKPEEEVKQEQQDRCMYFVTVINYKTIQRDKPWLSYVTPGVLHIVFILRTSFVVVQPEPSYMTSFFVCI